MSDQPFNMPSFDGEMAEILESFLVETHEIFDRFGQELLTLEKGNTGSELLNSIFRAVHTVKGTSSFLGLEQMTGLAHTFEDVLNKLRKGEITVSPDKMDVMFAAFDTMKALLEKIEKKDGTPIDLAPILERLRSIGDAKREKAPEAPPAQAAEPAGPQAPAPPAPAIPDAAAAPAAAQARQADTTVRVDVNRLDNLMNLVGELVLGRNRLAQITGHLNDQLEGEPVAKELSDTSAQIDFITTELQMAVMKTRMVPIAKVFNKLPRLIRDLCKGTGKEMELQLVGEETELDKSIIEELNDPLIHILRNAADHGIESPEDRRKAGKPAKGTVVVKAEHQGNHIVISIEDDGKGMDPESLKRKAVEKGIITDAQAREMSRQEAFNLVFIAGFSTAAKVTNVSGRGVGMDVVRNNITKLKGFVDIESDLGVGTKFILKLPLTLAIIQALLVQAGSDVFSIPLGSVLEVVRVEKEEIKTVNSREAIRLRNAVLPLARMAEVMGAGGNGIDREWTYVVVVGLAHRRLGIVVDSLLGQKEVVIKSLGDYLGTIHGIAGSTILGDGRVIMIVDVGELMELCAAA